MPETLSREVAKGRTIITSPRPCIISQRSGCPKITTSAKIPGRLMSQRLTTTMARIINVARLASIINIKVLHERAYKSNPNADKANTEGTYTENHYL